MQHTSRGGGRALITLLLLAALPCSAGAAGAPEPLAPRDLPGGFADVIAPGQDELRTDPAWALRTGLRKGVIDQTTDEERFAAPDGAVLRSGAADSWPSLLAEIREASVFAEPDDIAALAATKPYLIIPSGALTGLAGSAFFREGLAEYVRAGGVLLCFSQQAGGDYAALPVPAGGSLKAAGWSQDSGALFRASTIQNVHSFFAGIARTTPALETDGYFAEAPREATVLLSRSDGFPTVIVYPFGAGRVVATTLFSDVLSAYRALTDDELALVGNMVRWAKSGGAAATLTPGEELKFSLPLHGPDRGEAASVKISVAAGPGAAPLLERILPLSLAADAAALLPVSLPLPKTVPPGIYHTEYQLLDGRAAPLTASAESAGGWFALTGPASPAPSTRSSQPLSAFPMKLRVAARIDSAAAALAIDLEKESGPPGSHDLTVRAGAAVKHVRLSGQSIRVSFDLPRRGADIPRSYAVYHSSGRCLARGIAPAQQQANRQGLSLDRASYRPGETAKVTIAGMNSGEISVRGFGSVLDQMIDKTGVLDVPVPAGLPAGRYPLDWEFQDMGGSRGQGSLIVPVTGAQVRVIGMTVDRPERSKKTITASATLRVRASEGMSASLRVVPVLAKVAGAPLLEQRIRLAPGDQDVPLRFSFRPVRGGILFFRYEITAQAPEGPNEPAPPVVLAGGPLLVDAGDAAVLGIRFDKPLYYEAAGPVHLTALHTGRAGRTVEYSVDGKRARKEKIGDAGPAASVVPLPPLTAGVHTIAAAISADGLKAEQERLFTYGARLPDLSASIQAADMVSAVLSVGVGITNRGRTPARPSRAALYDGDPLHGGSLLQELAVPALEPGVAHVVIAHVPLAGGAGMKRLFAAANIDRAVAETSTDNNSAALDLAVPEAIITVAPAKQSFTPDEPVVFTARAVNLARKKLKGAGFSITITDPAGAALFTENRPLAALAPGEETTADVSAVLAAPKEGALRISASLTAEGRVIAAAAADSAVAPALVLTGSLDGTPDGASFCRPLALRYRIASTGTIPPTNGSVRLEIRSAGEDRLVYSKQVPLSLGPGEQLIQDVQFPAGAYKAVLSAQAVNDQRKTTRDFQLSSKPLTIGAPLSATTSDALVPRVLVWAGQPAAQEIERAVSGKILAGALDGEAMYVKIVTSGEDFTNEALSGLYTTYVFFELAELPGRLDWLQKQVAEGRGLALFGSTEQTRSIAEAFGFRFAQPAAASGTAAALLPGGALALSGSLPVYGPVLPLRAGAAVAAARLAAGEIIGAKRATDKGNVVLFSFSPIASAMQAGTTAIYSPLVRAAIQAAAPVAEQDAAVRAVLFTLRAAGGPVRSRTIVTLPPGSRLLWSQPAATLSAGAAVFELTASESPQEVILLYQPASPGAQKPSLEAHYECNGRFIRQGGIE